MRFKRLPSSVRSSALMGRVLDRISGSAPSSSSTSPQNRRIFRGDVERDEFQSASSHCLSSYYSVFVARLAIMVSSYSLSVSPASQEQYFCQSKSLQFMNRTLHKFYAGHAYYPNRAADRTVMAFH